MTARIDQARIAWLATMRAFLAFLARPDPDVQSVASAPRSISTVLLCLFVTSLGITALFGLLAAPLLLAGGAEPSDQFRQIADQPLLPVLFSVILLGPLVEEVMFRGWLSGSCHALIGSAAVVATVAGGPALAAGLGAATATSVQTGVAALALLLSRSFRLTGSARPVPGFRRAFPLLFWAQGAVFGILHIRSVSVEPPILALLPALSLVLCGWLWGYARMTIGLGGAVLLHAAYNVPALIGTLVLIASR